MHTTSTDCGSSSELVMCRVEAPQSNRFSGRGKRREEGKGKRRKGRERGDSPYQS